MLITVLLSLALISLVVYTVSKKEVRTETKASVLKISEIETLMHNIEIYNGTGKGQRRLDK